MSGSHEPGGAGAVPEEVTDLARLDDWIHHTELPRTALSERLDGFVRRVGEWVSWVWLALLGVIVLNVTLRYALGSGRIEFEEIQWHLYSIGFLAGLSYCVQSDTHVRVDFLHDRMGLRMQAWVELYGLLLLTLPFLALVGFFALPFVADSFAQGEISPSPGGLPYRWLLKAAIPLGFGLLALSCLARLLRVTSLLFGAPAPLRPPDAVDAAGAPDVPGPAER